MFLLFNLFVSFLLIELNCGQIVQGAIIDDLEAELKNNPIDASSFSRSDRFVTNHFNWKATINFEEQTIEGVVVLSVEKLNTTNKLVLDTSELTINKIIDKETNQTLKFELSPVLKIFGSKLTVELLNKRHSNISISYKTSPNASGLQWLASRQTVGKKNPYLFSQCQPIECRSIIPLQDSPAIKSTFEAKIVVPKSLSALMSALRIGKAELSSDGLTKEYKFKQIIPVPSYLIALVVGNLESKKIGPRSDVWSEPELIERSAYELADTENMLSIAESIMGPYLWGVYDILIVPPIYEINGMENPYLTFITPTILVGDRSRNDVVAHEIAHSWTGNLVTTKNWNHIWLNEGLATFIERKILGRLSGEPYRELRSFDRLISLKETILNMGPHNALTKLVPDVRGVDPSKGFSRIPYDKGETFLFYLEQKLGGPEYFEPFLREYIKKLKYSSIETNDFKSLLIQYFKDKTQILETIDWNSWLYSTGMPLIIPNYDISLIKPGQILAISWITANDSSLSQFEPRDISGLETWQIIDFLKLLLDTNRPFSAFKVSALIQIYGLRSKNNPIIRQQWLRLCLRAQNTECVKESIWFITSIGGSNLVNDIYQGLYDWKDTRKLAIETFQANQHLYMKSAIKVLSGILYLNDD